MATDSMEIAEGGVTPFWIEFFQGAGIPAGDAANYAMIFSDNRIQKGMLLDLTKEYLNDMSITVMGDVISILKHAKLVHAEESAKQRTLRAANFTPADSKKAATPARSQTPTPVVTSKSQTVSVRLGPQPTPVTSKPQTVSVRLGTQPPPVTSKSQTVSVRLSTQDTGTDSPLPPAAKVNTDGVLGLEAKPSPPPNLSPAAKNLVIKESVGRADSPSNTRRSTPASRMVDHYLKIKNDPDACPMNDPTPVPSLMSAQMAARLGPAIGDSQSSVFSRLGAEGSPLEPALVTVSGLGNIKVRAASQDLEASSSIFKRLGGEPPAASQSQAGADSEGSVFKRLGAVKRPAQSTSWDPEDDEEDSVVGYAGVLKSGSQSSPAKKPKLLVTARLGPEPTITKTVTIKPKVTFNARLSPEPKVQEKSEPKVALKGSLQSRAAQKVTLQPTARFGAAKKSSSESKLLVSARLGAEPSKKSMVKRLGGKQKVSMELRLGPSAMDSVPSSSSEGILSSRSTEGILSPMARTEKESVHSRLGKATATSAAAVSSTSGGRPKAIPGKAVTSRLGPKRAEVSSSADLKISKLVTSGLKSRGESEGIFKRLGK